MLDHVSSIDPFGGRLERSLREALPSFVHRLNNALAAVTGFASVAVLGGGGLAPDRTRVVSEQAERARTLARTLSEVAKPTEGQVEALDLVEWLARLEDFLDGIVEAYSATVALRCELDTAPVRAATRPLIQALFVALVEAAEAGAHQLEVVVRSVGEPGENSSLVALEVRGSQLGAPLPDEVLLRCGARAGAPGERGAQTIEFDTLAVVRAHAVRGAALSVLLVERDPFLRELVEQVLSEHGYRVFAHERVDECPELATPIDLLLLDAIAASTPSLRALLTRVGDTTPVAVMGRPSAPLDATWPHLHKPFRPGELLECVAARVTAR